MNRWLAATLAATLIFPALAGAQSTSPATPASPTRELEPSTQAPACEGAPGPSLRRMARALDMSVHASHSEAPAAPEQPPLWVVTGTADFYYSTNFNDPATGQNAFRAFDIKDEHGVHFSLLELAAERRRTPWGGRIDVDFGRVPAIVNALEPSDDKFWQYVQQLYISRNLTRNGSAYVDFGKWVTSHGAEVIEARDNFLYSRGILFTWAIPFYHFGLRGFKYFNDTDYLTLQVIRGWNAVTDNNDALTFGIGGSKTFGKTILTGTYMFGPEPDLVGGGKTRHLIDFVLTYKPTARWTFQLNGDYARQNDFGFGGGRKEDIDWMGLAGYARYQLNSRHALTARAEWLNDSEGVATGSDQNLRSVTLGYSLRLHKHLETRFEWRRDWSNARVFPENGGRNRSQSTFLVGTILSF